MDNRCALFEMNNYLSFYTLFIIILSAPLRKKYILLLSLSLSIIPILFLSLLKGKLYSISYYYYYYYPLVTIISFYFLLIILYPISSPNFTKEISSGEAAYKLLSPLSSNRGETLLHNIKHFIILSI